MEARMHSNSHAELADALRFAYGKSVKTETIRLADFYDQVGQAKIAENLRKTFSAEKKQKTLEILAAA
jgi:hypothetical protein